MHPPDLSDRFRGGLLGLALGDALGAPYEGRPAAGAPCWDDLLADAPPVLRWTDDTAMAWGLARSLAERRRVDPDHLARTWAADFDPARGYGGGAARLLRRIAQGAPWATANRLDFPEGSFGNGAAMRALPLGLFFHAAGAGWGGAAPPPPDAPLVLAARAAAEVTHPHPEGRAGGVLLALAGAAAVAGALGPEALSALAEGCEAPHLQARLHQAWRWLDAGLAPGPAPVAEALGNGVAAADSAATALYLGVRFRDRPFASLLTFTVALGGDVDTLAAMAGGLWGAARGAAALPQDLLARVEALDGLTATADALLAAAEAAP